MIFGAVSFLLLIVCVNVAALMLARLASRRHEIAIRSALGAGRFQLVRQVLAESVLLSLAGGLRGLGLGVAGVAFVKSLPDESLPRLSAVQADTGVMLYTFVLAIGVALRSVSFQRSRRRAGASGRR